MRTSLFICIISLCASTFGQQSEKFSRKNSIEIELFGHGAFYSINYERLIINKDKFKTLGQLGFAYYPKSTGVVQLWIPISINQLFSFKSSHLEFGVGQIVVNDKFEYGPNRFLLHGSFKIGYRYQNPNGKFLFKAAFTPIIDYWDTIDENFYGERKVKLMPWAGLTIGYSF